MFKMCFTLKEKVKIVVIKYYFLHFKPTDQQQSDQLVVQNEDSGNTNKHLPLLARHGYDSLKSRRASSSLGLCVIELQQSTSL